MYTRNCLKLLTNITVVRVTNWWMRPGYVPVGCSLKRICLLSSHVVSQLGDFLHTIFIIMNLIFTPQDIC